MRIKNAESEGSTPGTVSNGGHTEGEQEQTRFRFGQEPETTRFGGVRLSTDIGSGIGSDDPGDGDIPPSKRKRGRPAGSKSTKSPTKLSPAELDAARGKLRDTLSGVVGFGVSWYGVNRANRYKKINPLLAKRVYDCYQIPKEAAVSVGEPLADTFIEWFPQYVNTANKAVDPGLALARLFTILQQTSANEKLIVMHYHQAMSAPTNGNAPNEPTDKVEEPIAEWMNQQSPTPEEILT